MLRRVKINMIKVCITNGRIYIFIYYKEKAEKTITAGRLF